MSTMFKWLGAAMKGLRSFAYGPTGGRPRVGLALGGGFARGIAHIGVLRVLVDEGIPIDCIAGTSVGGLIGAAYASGASLDEMERQGCATRFKDFGRWTFSRLGLASNERLELFLRRFSKASFFEELMIPLAIVATDLVAGESVYFTDGPLGPALRASCAYPGMFLPVQHRGRLLVDGFLTSTVPAEALRPMGADVVIAVHLEPGPLDHWPRNVVEVIGRSFAILQDNAHEAWRTEADVILQPNVRQILWDDFEKTPQLVAAGEAAARQAIPQIRAVLARRSTAPQRHEDLGGAVRESP
jgi:NTE family protein